MSPRKEQPRDPDHGYAVQPEPGDEIVHLQVKRGATVVLPNGQAYGDRCTLQVRRRDVDALMATGKVDEVDPGDLPDVAQV